MMKRFIIGAMLILGLCSWVKAQKIDVRIRVVDEWNRPLQGVMMRIGGNDDESFLSDKDGMIECRADKGAELNFEKYNQLQRKLKVTGEVMTVKLDKDNRLFELGYDQRVTKENTTAAIDGVSADEMKLSGEINPLNTLYGLIPGLGVYHNGSLPYNSTPDIYVRGMASNQGNKVLVLVDGVEREIGSLNVDEIESVTVLKDAASLALYGNRGTDGVICVTTKRGGNNKMRTHVGYNFTVQTPFRIPGMADAVSYANAVNEALGYDGLASRYTQADIQALQNGTSPLAIVDWKNQILRKAAFNHDLNLSFDGANERMRYYVFANYTSNRGFFNNTDLNDGYSTQVEMYALKLRTNLEANISPTTMARMNLMGRLMQYQQPTGGTSLANVYNTPVIAAPIYDRNGVWAKNQMFTNPLAVQAANGYGQVLQRTLFADLTIEQDLSMITPGLSAQVRVTYDNSADIADFRTKSYAYSIATPVHDAAGNISDLSYSRYGNDTEMSFASGLQAQVMRTYIWGKVNYERDFGKHHLDVAGIYSQGRRKYLGANGTNAFRDYMAHLSYNYDNRYLADVVCSYSGSLKMPVGDKYRVYPAVSVAWIASNEEFMHRFSVLDYLKLRASFGVTGNDSRLFYDMDKQFNGPGQEYIFVGTTSTGGLAQGGFPSKGIEPEKEYKANFGVEVGIWKGLSMQVDAFYNRRKNIRQYAGGVYSSVVGRDVGSLFTGEVKNYGGEITLGWQQQLDKFSYFIKGNFSYAKNEIVNINEEYHPYKYMYATGNSIGQLYGLMAEGLYQKEDFDAQGNLLPGLPVSTYESELRPGDVKYKDLNGDGKIDDYDHCHQQYSTLPEIYYGFSLGADYRNWGIKAHFQGVAHRSVSTMLASIYHPLYGNDKNVSEHYLENRWTDTTPDARYPRLTTLSNNHNFQTSSLWMEKGDYLKLRVLELSYKLPARFAEKMRMSDCRLFLKGMNLFSIDHVGIMDPEQMDMEYPSSRSYLIGINVLF